MTYAHDAHCNVIHDPGPDPCPPHCDDERHISGQPCPSCGSTVVRCGATVQRRPINPYYMIHKVRGWLLWRYEVHLITEDWGGGRFGYSCGSSRSHRAAIRLGERMVARELQERSRR